MRIVDFCVVHSFALASALTVSAALAAELWISEETLLDPGYRTASGDSDSHVGVCEVACGPNGGLAIWTGGPSGTVSARVWEDTTVIGRDAQYIPSVDRPGHDVSDHDGVGHKLLSLVARDGGQRALTVRAMDGGARPIGAGVEVIQAPAGGIHGQRLVWNSRHHVVAWIDTEERTQVVRLDRDLAWVDGPTEAPTVAAEESDLALAGDGSADWIAFRSATGQLRVERVAGAEPALGVDVAAIPQRTDVALAVVGGDPVVAWLDPSDSVVRSARITLSPIPSAGAVVVLGEGMRDYGLALSATDDVALVVWKDRDTFGQVVGRRLSRDGLPVDATQFRVDGGTAGIPQGEAHRTLDAASDGHDFWVTWSISGETFAPNASAGCVGRFYYREPVWLQKVEAVGEPLLTSPLELDRESTPRALGSYFNGASHIVLAQEFEDRSRIDSYSWAPSVGALPTPLPVDRFISGASNGTPCGGDWINDPRVRLLPDGAALTVTSETAYDAGYAYRERGFIVTSLTADGDFRARAKKKGSSDFFGVTAQVDIASVAGVTGTVYNDLDFADDFFGRVNLLLRNGGVRGDSVVVSTDSTSYANAATIAALPDGFLLAWVERAAEGLQIVSQIVDPAAPPAALTGAAFDGPHPTIGSPWLIAGPRGALCVYEQGDHDGTTTLVAVPFDLEGHPLDPAPRILAESIGGFTEASGVWTGGSYLVTWGEEAPSHRILALRVGYDGELLDSSPVEITSNSSSITTPSSDGEGSVVISYADRVRLLFDPTPPPPPPPPPPVDPTPSSATLSALPLPFRAELTFSFFLAVPETDVRLSIFDLTGRRVRELDFGALRDGSHSVDWDGRDNAGRALPSGAWIARLETSQGVRTTRVLRIR